MLKKDNYYIDNICLENTKIIFNQCKYENFNSIYILILIFKLLNYKL